MIRNVLSDLWVFIILLLLQVFLLSRIHLFGVATPLLIIYFVIRFRRDTPIWYMLISSFLLGLITDVFLNTPGVGAGSMTFAAMIHPFALNLFTTRESAEDLKPGFQTLGSTKYFTFCLILVAVFCALFFTLEAFSFFNILLWIECFIGSTALTLILVLAIANLRKH